MSTMVAADLNAGVIYGDESSGEYVYMPASEIGVDKPLCVLETKSERRDITLAEALVMVRRLSLRPARHPQWGANSC